MSELVIPRWAWVTAGVVTVGGLVGAMLWAARSPGYDTLLERAGAPREMFPFAALQRYTESRGNPKAGLGRVELFPNWAEPRNAPREDQLIESDAAAVAYDRNAEAYSESPYPKRMWVFGSGGPYGLIPGNALAPWKDSDALRRGRVTPYDVFNPWKATVFFLEYVRRLIARSEFRTLPVRSRNFLALKRGMASPSLLADTDEHKPRSGTVRRRAIEAARALHIAEDYLYEPVPLDWPGYRGAQELIP